MFCDFSSFKYYQEDPNSHMNLLFRCSPRFHLSCHLWAPSPERSACSEGSGRPDGKGGLCAASVSTPIETALYADVCAYRRFPVTRRNGYKRTCFIFLVTWKKTISENRNKREETWGGGSLGIDKKWDSFRIGLASCSPSFIVVSHTEYSTLLRKPSDAVLRCWTSIRCRKIELKGRKFDTKVF